MIIEFHKTLERDNLKLMLIHYLKKIESLMIVYL